MKILRNHLAMLGILAGLVSGTIAIGSDKSVELSVPTMVGYYQSINNPLDRRLLLIITGRVRDDARAGTRDKFMRKSIVSTLEDGLSSPAAVIPFLEKIRDVFATFPDKEGKYLSSLEDLVNQMKASDASNQ